jgi:hypothetical protein
MPAIIAAFIATVVPLLIVLYWIHAYPKDFSTGGQVIGEAFGQIGKGAGEGIITPIIEYTAVGGLIALGLALLYRFSEKATGLELGSPPSAPGFAPAPSFGSRVGVSAGPITGSVGFGEQPSFPPAPPPPAYRPAPRALPRRR